MQAFLFRFTLNLIYVFQIIVHLLTKFNISNALSVGTGSFMGDNGIWNWHPSKNPNEVDSNNRRNDRNPRRKPGLNNSVVKEVNPNKCF